MSGKTVWRTTRRTFLGGTAAGLALAALPRGARADNTSDVIVIGAGLAGLNAAVTLADQGLNVRVIEASNRIGGRVNTLDDVENRPEGGGSEVGTMYARVISTVERMGLQLRPALGDPIRWHWHIGGKFVSSQEWPTSDVNKLSGEARKRPPPTLESFFMPKENPLGQDLEAWLSKDAQKYDVPMDRFLRERGADDEALRFIAMGEGTDSLKELSVLWDFRRSAISSFTASQGIASLRHIVGGMSRLPEAMATTLLKNPVEKNVAAVGLRDDGKGVEVRTADGKTYRAKHAVVAVPLPMVKTLKFDPGLPSLQKAAYDTIALGYGTCIYFPVTGKYWEEDGLAQWMWSDSGMGRVMKWTNEIGDYLWVYFSGPENRRFRGKPDAEVLAYVENQLYTNRPPMKGRIGKGKVVNWSDQKWTRGTFLFMRPGEITRFGNVVANAHGRIHFAGEHTALLSSGLEGAMESGERAAVEVMEAI
jgi:monoamine oxidase